MISQNTIVLLFLAFFYFYLNIFEYYFLLFFFCYILIPELLIIYTESIKNKTLLNSNIFYKYINI